MNHSYPLLGSTKTDSWKTRPITDLRILGDDTIRSLENSSKPITEDEIRIEPEIEISGQNGWVFQKTVWATTLKMEISEKYLD